MLKCGAGSAALQIDAMADNLRARRSHREQRLQTAVCALQGFSVGEYEAIREQSESGSGPLPGIPEQPSAQHAPAAAPAVASNIALLMGVREVNPQTGNVGQWIYGGGVGGDQRLADPRHSDAAPLQ